MGDNECGGEVRMSTEEAQGNMGAEPDLKYILLFGSVALIHASVKFSAPHTRNRLTVEPKLMISIQ